MPRYNLLPAGIWENPDGGAGWTYVPAYANDLLSYIGDNRLVQSTISYGSPDSNGMWGINWVAAELGMQKPNWSGKRITNIECYINAFNIQATNTECAINLANWNSPPQTAFPIFGPGSMVFTGGAGWQFIAGGTVSPPGSWSSQWDSARDWILVDLLVYGIVHYNHDPAKPSSQFMWDAALVAVDYEEDAPPVPPGAGIISQF